MTPDTALAPSRSLPPAIARAVEADGLPAEWALRVFESVFKDQDPAAVALALRQCRQLDLDPFAGELTIIASRGGKPKPYVSVDGYLKMATRDPRYAGLQISEPKIVGEQVFVEVSVRRKDWDYPSGPFVGREKRSDEKAFEKARSKAIRAALRATFGAQMLPDDPDEDEQPEVAMMRDDQRRTLFALAAERGWDEDERRRRAGVSSFTELTEQQAARLIAAWGAESAAGSATHEVREPDRATTVQSPPSAPAADPGVWEDPKAQESPPDDALTNDAPASMDAPAGTTVVELRDRISALLGRKFGENWSTKRVGWLVEQAARFGKARPGELSARELYQLASELEAEIGWE